MKKHEKLKVSAHGFGARVAEIVEEDKAERSALVEKLRTRKPATLAATGEPMAPPTSAEPEYVAGDLLLQYGPAATLADRYDVLQDIQAESRNKLAPISVYRVRVAEDANLDQLIQAHRDDPRVGYMETDRLVSVPEPVEEDTRR